jgi:acetoin utilization deacetylase AcuC-like enzyme
MVEGGYSDGLENGLPAFLAGMRGKADPIGDTPTSSDEWAWKRYRSRI